MALEDMLVFLGRQEYQASQEEKVRLDLKATKENLEYLVLLG